MTIALIILVLAIGCVLGFRLWLRAAARKRREGIRRYSEEHGFQYLDAQPPQISLGSSSLKAVQSTSNAFTGTGTRNRFVFFDCRIREGRTSHIQSVLALERLGEHYPACRWDRELREERVGDWTLVYHPRRAWSLNEIDAHVSAL